MIIEQNENSEIYTTKISKDEYHHYHTSLDINNVLIKLSLKKKG